MNPSSLSKRVYVSLPITWFSKSKFVFVLFLVYWLPNIGGFANSACANRKFFGTKLGTTVIKDERGKERNLTGEKKEREAFKGIQRTATYQLHSPESSNAKGVDDVEIRQLQVGEESSLSFVSGFFDAKKWKFLRGANTSTTHNCCGMTRLWNRVYLLTFHLAFRVCVFSHSYCFGPTGAAKHRFALAFFFFFSKEKNTKYPLHAHPVTDKSSYQIKVTSWSFSTRLLVSTDCLSSFVVLFWIFLDLLGFGFAVQILEGSFSLASLIHRLAVASINVCYKRQDHWGLWSEVTARSYANRSKKLRADVQMPALDGLRSIFAFLKSVFPSFMFTHWLSAGNPRVFMCAGFLYEWWEKHGRGSQGLTMHTCKSNTCECVRCKISISWWDKWTWAA